MRTDGGFWKCVFGMFGVFGVFGILGIMDDAFTELPNWMPENLRF